MKERERKRERGREERSVHVCVRVCVRERKRESERETDECLAPGSGFSVSLGYIEVEGGKERWREGWGKEGANEGVDGQ